jgi:DNA-binding MarR family transcriptional regulator
VADFKSRARKIARRAPAPAERGKRPPRWQRDLPELDRLIHERVRLGMVSALAVNDSLTFNDLKRILKTTDGNLSVHARKLEDAGYVHCRKSFEGRVPRSQYTLTASGHKAFKEYLRRMEEFIAIARKSN